MYTVRSGDNATVPGALRIVASSLGLHLNFLVWRQIGG
jgi:hypothetical protein